MSYTRQEEIKRKLVYRAFAEMYTFLKQGKGYAIDTTLSEIEIKRLSQSAARSVIGLGSTRQTITDLGKIAFRLAKKLEANGLDIESILGD